MPKNADNFQQNSFTCGNLSLLAPFSDYSSNVLVLLRGWCPRQLSYCPTLGPALILYSGKEACNPFRVTDEKYIVFLTELFHCVP